MKKPAVLKPRPCCYCGKPIDAPVMTTVRLKGDVYTYPVWRHPNSQPCWKPKGRIGT